MCSTLNITQLASSPTRVTEKSETLIDVRARLHTGKFSSDKKISFVLNPLVAHGSSQDKEKLSVQGKFSCVLTSGEASGHAGHAVHD